MAVFLLVGSSALVPPPPKRQVLGLCSALSAQGIVYWELGWVSDIIIDSQLVYILWVGGWVQPHLPLQAALLMCTRTVLKSVKIKTKFKVSIYFALFTETLLFLILIFLNFFKYLS